MPPNERREFQRLAVDPPLAGTLSDTAVTIVELGVLGARVHHAALIEEKSGELRCLWNGEDIALRCEVVRTDERADRLESGLRFLAAVGDSGDRLRALLADLVERALQTPQPVDPHAMRDAIDGDTTVRGKDAAYLCYRLEGGVWNRRRVFLPEQPPVGFTVARSEDSDEMQRLCRVYQASDEEGRRLIRTFAELSISRALAIPPRA
jgi:hypothetical protein